MPNSELIISPVGRWIGGSMTETDKTDYQNRPIDVEKQQYSIGVAFRKDDPKTGEMLQAMAAHAFKEFAQASHIQTIIGTYNFAPKSGFSWKVKDGDAPNLKNQVNSNSAGCYVIYFTSSFVTKTCDQLNNEIGTDVIKRGWKIQVAFTVAGNTLTDHNAGIFVNPAVYRFAEKDAEILGGVDAATAFAGHDLPAHMLPDATMAQAANTSPVPPQVPPAIGQQPTPPALQPGIPTVPQNTPLTTGAPGSVPTAPTTPPALGGVQPHPTFANGPGAGVPQPGIPQVPGLPGNVAN